MGNFILRHHCVKEIDFDSQLAQVKSKFRAKKQALADKQKKNKISEYSELTSRNNDNGRRVNQNQRCVNRNSDICPFEQKLDTKYQIVVKNQRRNRTPDCESTPRFGNSESNLDNGFKQYRKTVTSHLINTADSESLDESIIKLEEEFNEVLNKIAEADPDEGYNSILYKLETNKI